MLVESSLFQIWMSSCKKKSESSSLISRVAVGSSSIYSHAANLQGSSEKALLENSQTAYLGHDYEERWLREEGAVSGGRRESGYLDMKWSERVGRGEHFSEGVGARERAGPRAESGSRVRRERLVYASGDEDAGEGFVMGGKMRRSVSGNRG
jgi:uncharacterized protein involved in copper resistance